MNEKYITFHVDKRKFTTKLVLDDKSNNRIYYYTMSELENIIDLTLIENDITEIIEDDDKGHPIMIDSKKNDISSESNSKTEQIPD